MRDYTDLTESFVGEEGVAVAFPLLGAWWDSIFNLFLAWEDCIGEWIGESWEILLTGGGVGRDKLANHDVGRLSGGKSPAIRRLQGL
jgi:hypothetical protein